MSDTLLWPVVGKKMDRKTPNYHLDILGISIYKMFGHFVLYISLSLN